MVAQTRHGGQPSPKKKLDFRDKLVGKGLSTDALLKKMKTLHTQLAALDQEHVDVNSLNTARKELIHTSVLLHKDRGVKAYAACCLADILRLYAPDAPYTQAELRDIFQFFFKQLSAGLKGSDASYYNDVVLVCDLPSADDLMSEIFKEFFTIVKRDLPKKVEGFMADIMVALIDESQSVPSDVLDIIMAQFADKNARLDQSSYRLAAQVVEGAADKLQRNVSQYFNDITSRVALHRSCPAVLHTVIPQLEEELRADDVTIRLLATQVLGEMFSDKGGSDLVRNNTPIRLKVIESCRGLVMNLPECRQQLEGLLCERVMDPDDKVRSAVCKLYSQLDYEAALHTTCCWSGLDKRQSVRVEALNAVGKLYNLAYPEIDSNDPAAIKQFAWIPDEVLKVVNTSPEIRSVVEQVVADHLLPLPSGSSSSKGTEFDEVAWTERLLGLMRYLSDKSINALLGLSGLKAIRPNIYDVFLETCIQYNGGIMDEDEELITRRLTATAQHLASTFPEPVKAKDDLQAFAKLNENRLFKLAKTCLDSQTDLKTLAKSHHEFFKRLEQLSSTLVPTLSIFLRRASFRIINQSSVPSLLKRVGKSHGSTSEWLIQASNHAKGAAHALSDEKNVQLVGVALQALAGLCLSSVRRTNEKLERFALHKNLAIARYSPTVFEHRSSVLMDVLLKKDDDDGEEWLVNEEIPELLRAKIQAVKVCRNRCLAHGQSEKALEIATPALKMFATLLEQDGSLNPGVEEDPKFMSRMRLQAAFALLHLSTIEVYSNAITPKFARLALTVQDPCFNVRLEFLVKVLSLLQPRKIPPRFNVIPFITVHDPEDEVKNLAASYVASAKRKLPAQVRVESLELVFIRLLHLLAHHPDFSTQHDDLLDIAKYIQLYLDLVASQDNLSLLNHLAMKLKTVRDAESHSSTEHLYMISELAQELIKIRASNHSWTIQTYPGKVRLPSDILRPLPTGDAAKEIVKTVYLPEEAREWLSELSKTALPKEKKERKRKAEPTKSNGQSKRRRRRRADDDDDDDDNDGGGSENSDDEMDVDEPPSSPKSEDARPRGTRFSARNAAKKGRKSKGDSDVESRESTPLTGVTDEEE
ncbi:cohesin-associated protein Pds5 [Coprinopsis sp. MPI-PUGE-AT-0042]|nr:cohesin-associated protein Pds5 [Coprinopsis sp. MPI-PUGE-AT-0042]